MNTPPPCPLWGDVSVVNDRLHFRYDFLEPEDPREAQYEYRMTQDMLCELGWEIEEPEVEHDCVSGLLRPKPTLTQRVNRLNLIPQYQYDHGSWGGPIIRADFPETVLLLERFERAYLPFEGKPVDQSLPVLQPAVIEKGHVRQGCLGAAEDRPEPTT